MKKNAYIPLNNQHHNAATLFMGNDGWKSITELVRETTPDVSEMDRRICFLEGILQDTPSFPSSQTENLVTLSMFILLSLRKPDHQDIEVWEEKAFMIVYTQKDLDIDSRFITGVYLCAYYLWTGHFGKATLLLNFLQETGESSALTDMASISLKTAEALFSLFMESGTSCIKKISDALQSAKKTGVDLWDGYLLMHGLTVSLYEEDIETFEELRKKLDWDHDKGRRFDIAFYHFLLAWKSHIDGDLDSAFHYEELALKLADKSSFLIAGPVFYIKMAEIQHERGHRSEAESYLSKAWEEGRKMKSLLFEYLCLFLETQMAFDTADKNVTSSLLNKLFAMGRRHNFMNVCLINRSFMTRLCMKALQSGIEVDFTLDLVRKHRLMPDTPPLDIENWPYPVEIYTLGRFKMIKDGDPVKLSGKTRNRPASLLKVLIAMGGLDVPKEKIIDIIWPETDGDLAHTSLETTLHRLRKLFGDNRCVQHIDGQLSIDPSYCSVDTWTFEHLYNKIEAVWQYGKKNNEGMNEAIRLSEKAVSLYQGHFLPADSDCSWSLSKRKKLRNKFIRVVVNSGEFWGSKKQWKKAIECFRHGLEVDEFAEEFYSHLIICYKNLGLHTEAANAENMRLSIFAERNNTY